MSFRLDRFATLYVFNPLLRHRTGHNSSIPILMYHSISEEDETKVHAYYRTSTSPQVFTQHMQHLRDLGYRTIALADAARLLQNGRVTKKYVVVTFDDGYADFYNHAFPELSRHGFTATMFLPTGYIGSHPIQFKGKNCLTWSQVRELRKHGMCFGSHTVSHPRLSTLDPSSVKSEIANSKQVIEENLGESVDSFAYPFAFPENNKPFIQVLRNILAESRYRQGVSTSIGTARPQEDPYFLRRLPVNSSDDISLFRAKLQGGYDWLRKFQYASKQLRPYF